MDRVLVDSLKKAITQKLTDSLSVSPEFASDEMYYRAVALVLRDRLAQKERAFAAQSNANGKKRVSYLCMEFLLGRSLKNNLYNLELVEPMAQALSEFGVSLEKLEDQEPDAGLGNGGLGRLAAGFLDALATCGYPGTGYCILYEFGIFRQKIIDGWQTELPDRWLPGGEVWLTPRPEQAVEVRFGGTIEETWEDNYHLVTHKNYQSVQAVPYDLYVSGYQSKGVSILRLWSAKSPSIDMEKFNSGDYVNAFGQSSVAEAISKILYPNDNHVEGKLLRLRQQYFLCAASIADIVRTHMQTYGTLDNFAEKNAIHINDTHPALAIPELMRVLLDDCGYRWEQAWSIVYRTFAYTNHTVMKEALETWNSDLFRTLLPRIYTIVCEINQRFCTDLSVKHHLDLQTISRMAIVAYHEVRMANLCVAGCHSVNGVSKLHSGIIRHQVFQDFYRVDPQKFQNVTNGIASRRWLYQSNQGLTDLCRELIGPDFLRDLSSLAQLKQYRQDPVVLQRMGEIKLQNKERFAQYLLQQTGAKVDPHSIFEVQVKRLHEYKRQHLNALHILALYRYLKANPNAPFYPHTFIFGAKAAPGYYLAKQIIKFICSLRDMIDGDPQVREKLKVVYLEDYNVTLSEHLMPAADLSLQISLAGTEASGTGNMKLMLNGAITLGTMDGANVEIYNAVGPENILIFGMDANTVEQRKPNYDPYQFYRDNPVLTDALDFMETGFQSGCFADITDSLKYHDPYMVLADFDSYCKAQEQAAALYQQTEQWEKMSLENVASSGVFCADRAIRDYANNIWHL